MKRTLCLMLCAVLLFSLSILTTGCGGGTPADTSTTTTTFDSSSSTTDADSDTPPVIDPSDVFEGEMDPNGWT